MTKEELIDEITKVSARMLKERLEEKPLKERFEELAEKGIDFLEGLNLWRLNYEGSGEVGGVKFSHYGRLLFIYE